MIESFVDSVLIIDDQEKEVSDLKSLLDSKQIYSGHHLPEVLLKEKIKLKNRKLIFLDLFVDEAKATLTDQLSLIRNIFKNSIGNDFGSYGIVLWTKHSEHFEEFKEKFFKSYKMYDLPLFIVPMNKSKYLKDGFDEIFSDLDNILLNNPASNFFMCWEIAVNKSKDQSIRQIYDLVNIDQDENLIYVLFHLARNYTGIPYENLKGYNLEHDALKAFSDLLMGNINNFPKVNYGLFSTWKDIEYCGNENNTQDLSYSVKNFIPHSTDNKEIRLNKVILTKKEKKEKHAKNIGDLENEIRIIQSKVNTVLLFDNSNLDKSTVFPGNIYKILDGQSPFIMDNIPEGSVSVAIEITPPCDFSQNKFTRRRLISGFYCDYNKGKLSKINGDNYYKEIWPVWLDDQIKMIVFDFRDFGSINETDLKNPAKYDLFLKAKNKMFADILQKLSSHTARLGLSVLH